MAGLIGLLRAGAFKDDQNLLFVHTGGALSLFAYREVVLGGGEFAP